MPAPPMPTVFKLSANSLPRFELSLPSVLQTWLPMWLSEILKVPRLIPPGGEQGGAGEIVFFPGLAARVEKLRGKSLGHRVGGSRHW